MIRSFKSDMIIPDYKNLKESRKDKKYVCTCDICDKKFKCSIQGAQICKKCCKKYAELFM